MNSPSTNNSLGKLLLALVVIAIIGFLGFAILTMPDNRTTGERIGDAVDALPQGVGKAAEQLEDRTPGEKLGDAVEDAGEKIKDNTQN
ncbi:hypothetical protein GC177_08710 [bacterium]|nr:hypothetical protein [bacterium]